MRTGTETGLIGMMIAAAKDATVAAEVKINTICDMRSTHLNPATLDRVQ